MCMASMSMGNVPAVCAVSKMNTRPWRRQNAPISSAGISVPHTLLPWSITTAFVSGRSSFSASSMRRLPSAPQGMRSKVTPLPASWTTGRITALCSMADTSTWSPLRSRPFSSTFRLSVMFLVNTTLRQSGP